VHTTNDRQRADFADHLVTVDDPIEVRRDVVLAGASRGAGSGSGLILVGELRAPSM
jgi:hypothetical protein